MTALPIWALVVGRPPRWLTAQLGDLDDLPLDAWEIAEGDEGHAALLSYDVGSEGVDGDIARALSRSGHAVYDVRLAEDHESVRLFEDGAYAHDVEAEPHEFLAARGFDVRSGAPVRARSVIVVEDARPAEVAAALQLDPTEVLHVEPVPAGTVVFSDTGDISPLLRLVASNLPSKTVYLLAHLPGDHFFAQAVRGDDDLGVLYAPPGADPQLPTLSSVRGERDAAGIARAFGVPPGLLALPADPRD